MNEQNSQQMELSANLVLLFLLERVCAGFLSWVLDSEDNFDKGLKAHLNKRISKLNADRLERERMDSISIGNDPFDRGLTIADLSEYLKAAAKPDARILGGDINPVQLFNRINELKSFRNKIMHGISYLPDTQKTATEVYAVFSYLRAAVISYLPNLRKPPNPKLRDHTLWARMLFLSQEELVWISHGNTLPRVGDLDKASCRFPYEAGDIRQEIALSVTDHFPGNLGELLRGRTPGAVWVSDAAYDTSWLSKDPIALKKMMGLIAGRGPVKWEMMVLPTGPVDRSDDWFGVPWWQEAAAKKSYLWMVALA